MVVVASLLLPQATALSQKKIAGAVPMLKRGTMGPTIRIRDVLVLQALTSLAVWVVPVAAHGA